MTRHRRLTDCRRRIADLYFLESDRERAFEGLVGITLGLHPRHPDPGSPGLSDPDWPAYAEARNHLWKLAARLSTRINGAPVLMRDVT